MIYSLHIYLFLHLFPFLCVFIEFIYFLCHLLALIKNIYANYFAFDSHITGFEKSCMNAN